MGGKAIKKVKVNRFSGSEYLRIYTKIMNDLLQCGIKSSVPHHLSTKETFGDLDILVKNEEDFNLKEWIISTYNPIEIVSGTCFSIAYLDDQTGKYFQVDFIPVKYIDAAMLFFSYGDVGSIIGRYAAFNGFTFSEDGISIKVRKDLLKSYFPDINLTNDRLYVYDKIHLTYDVDIILEILGMNKEEWLNINNSESLFNWVLSSRFYNRDAFLFVPMNKKRRLEVRPLYKEFLKRIGVEDYDNIENKIIADSCLDLQMQLLQRFDKIDRLRIIYDRITIGLDRKEKFNSTIFIELGVEKKQLSIIMKLFKETTLVKFGEYNLFDRWLDDNDKETINNEIRMLILEL